MAITKNEARAVAKGLLAAAEAVDAYLDANFQLISRAEYEFLNESFKTLLRVSTFVTTVAVGLAIDALEDPVTALKGTIERAKEKIKHVQTVGLVIRLVAGLADLAAGIMARDPTAIVASIMNLNNQIKPDKDK